MTTLYDRNFYNGQSPHSLESARIITPYVLDLIKVTSVCDVGCGVGTWLRAFSEAGVTSILGMDGDYVNRDQLQIDQSQFVATDLREPINITERFDLAVSLEVAEHLPSERAVGFVADLTELSDHILFSAAIPGQGGTDHINEKWQSYWAEIFLSHDYVACDMVRPKFWSNKGIDYWYRQNILLYVKRRSLNDALVKHSDNLILDVVHPQMWASRAASLDKLGFSVVASSLPSLGKKAIYRKFFKDN
jgi:SAM-dependent methyltransferase